jgi:3-methyladenine DNA glycosylase AlkD
MIASAAVKDREAPPQRFLDYLPIIDRESGDDRNFVRKAVSWALRQIGKRDAELHEPALELARKLAETPETRWVGKDALRELDGAKVRERLGLG